MKNTHGGVLLSGQDNSGAPLTRAPAVHQKQHQGERNNVYLKYIFISIFIINLGFNSNRWTIKCQLERNVCASRCLCRFRKCIYYMQFKTSHTGISINFVNVCSKPALCIINKFDTGFFSSCSLTSLHNLHLSQHVFLLVCILISASKPSGQQLPKFKNEILRKGVESFQN